MIVMNHVIYYMFGIIEDKLSLKVNKLHISWHFGTPKLLISYE